MAGDVLRMTAFRKFELCASYEHLGVKIHHYAKPQTVSNDFRRQYYFDQNSCFFDKGQLVIIANGFQKKDQKTPKKEIERALKIKEEYENEKKKHPHP